MPHTLKDPNLILAEKLVDDMNRFMKENTTEIPKEFSDLATLYKKDGKVTFKDQPALQVFRDKLLDVNFGSSQVGHIMVQSALAISDLAKNEKSQLESKLNNLTKEVTAISPQFYNKDHPIPTMPPVVKGSQTMNEYTQELSQWKQKMAVRTGFSKIFHEHLKHLPGNLLESVKAIMKSSEEKTEARVKTKKEAKTNQNKVTPPSKKKLAQAQKQGLKKLGSDGKKSRFR